MNLKQRKINTFFYYFNLFILSKDKIKPKHSHHVPRHHIKTEHISPDFHLLQPHQPYCPFWPGAVSWQLLWLLPPHPLWTGNPTKRKRATSLYCINEFFILRVEPGIRCLKTVFLYFGADNSKVYYPKIRKIILHFGQLLLLRKNIILKNFLGVQIH